MVTAAICIHSYIILYIMQLSVCVHARCPIAIYICMEQHIANGIHVQQFAVCTDLAKQNEAVVQTNQICGTRQSLHKCYK